jgi:GMP synthase-like glutamine amidotransferase
MGAVPARIAFLQHSPTDVPGLLGTLADGYGLDVTVHPAGRGPTGLPAPGTFDLLVVMGSVESVTDTSVPWIAPERALVAGAVEDGVPVLGVCFGGQLLAEVLGGTVSRAPRTEIGWASVDTVDPERIGPGPWLNWHHDTFTCPPGAEALARSELCLQAFVRGPHTGVQFHPEVTAGVVHGWIDEARDGDGVSDADVATLLSGFDADGRGPEDQPRALLHGFLTRADVAV